MTTATIIAAILYGLLGAGCLLLTLITLPGNWLLVLMACGFQLWSVLATDGQQPLFSWWTIAAGLALALLGELAEVGMGAAGAAATGARQRGIWGAVIGSLLGALVGLVFVFVPVIGSLLGALAGAAAGAFIGELTYKDRRTHEAAYAAVGAAAGRFAGILVKLSFGVAIWVLFVVAALWN
ncbi:MAG: DUF456 family protein [Phycisphaerales bacterium]